MTEKPCIRFALALFVWALLFSAESIAVIAVAVALHEGAHFAACFAFKVKILSFTPKPWGVCINTTLIRRKKALFVIYAAGPACNFAVLGVCAAVKCFFKLQSANFDLFMLANFAGGFLNLLPALPLDGGIILKLVLCMSCGISAGYKKAIRISAATGAVIFVFGAAAFLATGYNFSYATAGAFILFNLKKENQMLLFMKEKVLSGEIVSEKKIKYISVDASCHAICLANLISFSHTAVFLVNNSGKFVGEVPQSLLLKKLFKNSLITVGECVEKF